MDFANRHLPIKNIISPSLTVKVKLGQYSVTSRVKLIIEVSK